MQQCDKYINGVPSQSWLATIITLEVDDFVMIVCRSKMAHNSRIGDGFSLAYALL